MSGSNNLILIRFLLVSFSDSNFVFYVADDDHQWSVCCHQIPEGLEHTLYLHHSKLFFRQIYILHAIVDSSDEDYFAFSA